MASESMDLLNSNPEPAPAGPKARRGARAAGKPEPKAAHRGAAKAPAAVAEPEPSHASPLPPEREPAPLVLHTERIPEGEALWTRDRIALLKRTLAKNLTDDEFELYLTVCRRTRLDPFIRQIYAVKRREWDSVDKCYREKMVIQTGIDGYRLISDRTGRYAPGPAPVWSIDEKGDLVSATAFIKKQTRDGEWHLVEATAFWAEYVPMRKDDKTGKIEPTGLWKKMPRGQIAKCAEALAHRKAFPSRFGGIYIDEEMEQADDNGGARPSRSTTPQDLHDMMSSERKKQDEAAEGPVIPVDRGGQAEASGTSDAIPAASAPKSSAEPPAPRGSAPASPATTRTDGKTAAAGMVTTIRRNAERCGLYDEKAQQIFITDELASQVGLGTGNYTPESLASMVIATEIATALFNLSRRVAPGAK